MYIYIICGDVSLVCHIPVADHNLYTRYLIKYLDIHVPYEKLNTLRQNKSIEGRARVTTDE